MSEVRISAEPREATGRSAARAIRRAGRVPGVIYGHGEDVRAVTLDARDLRMALRQQGALLSVSLAGKDHLALPKEVVRHPVKDYIEHIDLLLVRRGEKVTVDVPVVVVGEAVSGGVLSQAVTSLSIEVEATSIPAALEVNVDGMDVGDQRLVSDLALPAGSVTHTAPDEVVLSVLAPVSEAAATAPAEGEGAEEAGVEPAEEAGEEASE